MICTQYTWCKVTLSIGLDQEDLVTNQSTVGHWVTLGQMVPPSLTHFRVTELDERIHFMPSSEEGDEVVVF